MKLLNCNYAMYNNGYKVKNKITVPKKYTYIFIGYNQLCTLDWFYTQIHSRDIFVWMYTNYKIIH